MPDFNAPLPDSISKEILKRWDELFGRHREYGLRQEFIERVRLEETQRLEDFLEGLWIAHVAGGGRRPWYR